MANKNYIGVGQPLKQTYAVVVVVYMSRYLESGDSSGTNDPMVIMQCGESVRETSIQYNKLNGVDIIRVIYSNLFKPFNKGF